LFLCGKKQETIFPEALGPLEMVALMLQGEAKLLQTLNGVTYGLQLAM